MSSRFELAQAILNNPSPTEACWYLGLLNHVNFIVVTLYNLVLSWLTTLQVHIL